MALFRSIILSFFITVNTFVSAHYFLDRFENWVRKFKVKLETNEQMLETYRKWVANDKFITEHNSRNLSFVLDHNQFSGMDSADFSKYLSLTSAGRSAAFPETISTEIPMVEYMEDNTFLKNKFFSRLAESIDWVEKGAVTPVKDQGQCGSCWSFSTTGALEGAYFIKYGVLASFSEQQLVDCDNLKNGGRDHGCNGGIMDSAFSWINKNNGLCSEQAYPYVSGTTETSGSCQSSCTNVKNSKIAKYIDVPPSSDNAMMTALNIQPVSVAIEADQREFQLYKSGVFTSTCGTNLDHGVLVVGYGTLNGEDYYKVKNSWGTSWGSDGFILLGRGSQYNKGSGQCGVLLEASYPVL